MIGNATSEASKQQQQLLQHELQHRLQPPPQSPLAAMLHGNGTLQRPLSTPLSNGKMNGSLLHIRHSAPPPPSLLQQHHHGLNTSLKLQGFDLSARELFVAQHSLHDTSLQELSRGIGSGSGGVPRMRTPNNPATPTLLTSPGPSTPSNPGGSAVSSASSPSPPNAGGMSPQTAPLSPASCTSSPLRIVSARDHSGESSTSVNELLASLALLSTVSVLLAFLAVLVLLKVMAQAAMVDGLHGPPCNVSGLHVLLGGGSRVVDSSEYKLVYDVVIGLTTCTISLDFTCLLICCAQFIFASKLAKSPHGRERAIQYLRHSSFSRVVAIGGFFISIPVLLTGIILYAFIQFESKSAIITSLALGISIVFCGLAMIHNVYVWQQEKTKFALSPRIQTEELKVRVSHSEQASSQGFGDLTHNASLELSTLV